MASLTIENLRKNYGATKVLKGIDIEIDDGGFLVLVGPSGCGKTTLLRMIAGFIDPAAGSIYFNDREVTSTPANKRNTGMVFQSYALWPHMPVEANVAFGLGVRKVPKAQRLEQAREALAAVQMDQYAKRKPNQLSGGQQQRVAIARSLAMRPAIMLFDEVTAALDPETVKEVLVTIKDLAQDGMTCILVTHEMGFAREVADHIYFTDRGVIVEHGPPATFFDNAQDPRTQEFLSKIL